MKITILSGGSGNDSLIRGLKSLYKNIDVKVIVNAYDNGLSTGVCRSITNTLGVSDIRKNHIRMYKAMNPDECLDTRLIEFYEGRYNLEPNREATAISLLDGWGLKDKFGEYVHNFFKKIEYAKENMYNFDNFNVANIVFSEMYSELGYEKTNKISCDLLGIDDFVILNSFQNVYLNAITNDYSVMTDEGDIVKLCDYNRKIINTFYTPKMAPELNTKAVDAILHCDLLLISTGTFWSSIYPTLQYGDLYKYINESTAKKIWAMNNTEDKDAYGVSSSDFIDIVSKLGLDLSSFTILENLCANDLLKQEYQGYNIVQKVLGSIDGKHDSKLFATALLLIYYGLNVKYDHILFDFDDTLYSRSDDKKVISYNNLYRIKVLKDYVDVKIVSGNTYSSIENKLIAVYGTDTSTYPDIWADANSCLYVDGEIVTYIGSHRISDYRKVLDALENYGEELNDKIHEVAGLDPNGYYLFNIKIKPLTSLERKLLCDILNSSGLGDAIAVPTGKTTVDILSANNSKANTVKGLDGKVLYIGDEIDKGNDRSIALACDSYIKVTDVEETNVLLQLLCDCYYDLSKQNDIPTEEESYD